MRRLGVFVFYDPQGIVDDYVDFLLAAMCGVCTEIVTVCNGSLTEAGRKRLDKYSRSVFCRENRGMDAGALQDYFINLGNAGYWQSFDELVWFNDTCYGPVYPFSEMFDEMSRRGPFDFWGITAHAESDAKWAGSRQKGIPEHIQSYFVVVTQKLLKDRRFEDFWRNLSVSDDFNKTVASYELAMTRTFASWGYSYGVYCDTRKLDANPGCVCNLAADAMAELVRQYRCPLIKRKNFIRSKEENLINRYGEQVFRTMEYIKEHHLYDTAMIYRNLMRLYDQKLWKNNLIHHYIFSAETSGEPAPENSLILAEIDHEDTADELSGHLTGLPENCALTVVTRTKDLVSKIRSHLPAGEVLVLPDRPEGLAGLIRVLQQMDTGKYAYFCILLEEWGKPVNGLHLTESSVRDIQYGNLAAGPDFIRNVLRTFQKNPAMGILQAPTLSEQQNWEFDPELCLKSLGITLSCRIEKHPVVCRHSFWCRSAVIREIIRLAGERLPQMKDGVLQNLVSLFALNAGYYCGEAAEERWAAFCLASFQQDSAWNMNEKEIQYMLSARKFREAAAINEGKLAPESSGLTIASCFSLLVSAFLYFIEKKLVRNVPDEKRNAFFLGFRDVFQTFRKLIKSKYRRKKD